MKIEELAKELRKPYKLEVKKEVPIVTSKDLVYSIIKDAWQGGKNNNNFSSNKIGVFPPSQSGQFYTGHVRNVYENNSVSGMEMQYGMDVGDLSV